MKSAIREYQNGLFGGVLVFICEFEAVRSWHPSGHLPDR
jgi:hypothetical protein